MSSQDDYKHENEDFKHVLAVQREFITPLTNHERRCSLEKDFDHLANKSRQICTFIDEEGGNCILGDAKDFRKYLDGMIAQYPELFPVTIRQGYTLHDILPESVKMPRIRLRRIKVTGSDGFCGFQKIPKESGTIHGSEKVHVWEEWLRNPTISTYAEVYC